MNCSHLIPLLALITSQLLGCEVAHANEPMSSGRPPWQPDFSVAEVPPETPSAPPTKTDWQATAPAEDARVTEPGCIVKRIREWVRVECKFVSAIERVSGPHKDVSFGCFNEVDDGFGCDEGSVTFPLRRGERRTFQSFRPTKWSSAADSLISGQFLHGDKAPLVSVQGIRHGF